MKFKLQTVAPAQGLQWVQGGMRELLHRPLAYMSLLMTFMLGLMVAAVLPGGTWLMMLAVPLLSLGFVMATRASLNGHLPGPGVYVAPWISPQKRHRGPLLTLCGVYAVLSWSAMMLGNWIDGGALNELLAAANNSNSTDAQIDRLVNAPGLLSWLMVRVGLTMMLGLPFWHAPALVVWAGQGAAQAMFSSTLAVWRSRGAFVVYGLGWFGLTLLVGSLSSLAASLLGNGAVGNLIVMLLGLAITSAYYASQFFTFRDNFLVEPDER